MKTFGRKSVGGADAASIAGKRRKRPVAKMAAAKKARVKTASFGKAMRAVIERRRASKISIDLTNGREPTKTLRHITFGAVTVSNTVADEQTLVSNVKAGRDALVRAKDAFTKPGITLAQVMTVPRFRVDAHNPKIIIRELDGHLDRGSIVNGAFVPVD